MSTKLLKRCSIFENPVIHFYYKQMAFCQIHIFLNCENIDKKDIDRLVYSKSFQDIIELRNII